MTPKIRSVGRGPAGRATKQRSRAEARVIFGSGSLTWFRRPRLASPTLTTEVESNHPHVWDSTDHCDQHPSILGGHRPGGPTRQPPFCYSSAFHLSSPCRPGRPRRRVMSGACRAERRASAQGRSSPLPSWLLETETCWEMRCRHRAVLGCSLSSCPLVEVCVASSPVLSSGAGVMWAVVIWPGPGEMWSGRVSSRARSFTG